MDRHAPLLALALAFGFQSACLKKAASAEERNEERAAMVREQIRARGVTDQRVLRAMERVKRHLFVPWSEQSRAYADHPLPIGEGQTISQPYIVAFMSEALRLKPEARVLEVGTGSGYQAAVLAELVKEVYTIEIVPSLGRHAAAVLKRLGYRNATVRVGDGFGGWPEKAPFDGIMLTAAPAKIPEPLLQQLRAGGMLVAPVGRAGDQRLIRITRTATGFKEEFLLEVRFVPMTGKAQTK
jgi:protein-L-isoaspartate(D-aspartate) O-methyltransferase